MMMQWRKRVMARMGLDEDDTDDIAEVSLGLRLRYHSHTQDPLS